MQAESTVLLVSLSDTHTELAEELERLGARVVPCTFTDAEEAIETELPDLIVLTGARGALELATLLDDQEGDHPPKMVIVAERRELAKLRGLNREVVVSLFALETTAKVVSQRIESLARRAARRRAHAQQMSIPAASPFAKKTSLGLPTVSPAIGKGNFSKPPGVAAGSATDAGASPFIVDVVVPPIAAARPAGVPLAPPRPKITQSAPEDSPESEQIHDEDLLESIIPESGESPHLEIPGAPGLPTVDAGASFSRPPTLPPGAKGHPQRFMAAPLDPAAPGELDVSDAESALENLDSVKVAITPALVAAAKESLREAEESAKKARAESTDDLAVLVERPSKRPSSGDFFAPVPPALAERSLLAPLGELSISPPLHSLTADMESLPPDAIEEEEPAPLDPLEAIESLDSWLPKDEQDAPAASNQEPPRGVEPFQDLRGREPAAPTPKPAAAAPLVAAAPMAPAAPLVAAAPMAAAAAPVAAAPIVASASEALSPEGVKAATFDSTVFESEEAEHAPQGGGGKGLFFGTLAVAAIAAAALGLMSLKGGDRSLKGETAAVAAKTTSAKAEAKVERDKDALKEAVPKDAVVPPPQDAPTPEQVAPPATEVDEAKEAPPATPSAAVPTSAAVLTSAAVTSLPNPFKMEDTQKPSCDSLLSNNKPEVGKDPVHEASLIWADARDSIVTGKLEQANLQMCQAISLNPESAAVEGLANLYLRFGSLEQALHWADKAEALRPGQRDINNLQGDVYALMGDVEKARTIWLKVLNVAETEAARIAQVSRDYSVEAGGYFRRGDLVKAELWFRRAVILDPKNLTGLIGLAKVYVKAEKPEYARAFCLMSLELSEVMPEVHVMLGDLALARGDKGEARQRFERALAVRPGYFPAKRGLQETE